MLPATFRAPLGEPAMIFTKKVAVDAIHCVDEIAKATIVTTKITMLLLLLNPRLLNAGFSMSRGKQDLSMGQPETHREMCDTIKKTTIQTPDKGWFY